MSWISRAMDWLKWLWTEMQPDPDMAPQPELRRLDDDRAELSWHGPPFLFDRRSQTVSRAGRTLAHYSAVQRVIISEINNDGATWSVSLETGWFSSVWVGTSREQVDASIAAAHIAKVMGKQVRVY